MKHLITTILTILCSSLWMNAQSDYVVYDCTTEARIYRQDAKKWDTLNKGEHVNANTLINARTKSALKILDKNSNLIYSNVNTGNQRVSEIVKSSVKRANSTLKNLNGQIAQNIKGGTQGSKNPIYGATVRGNEELSMLDSLYYSVYNGIVNPRASESILATKVAVDNETFYFSITNNSGSEYYITFIHGNSNGIKTCIPDDLYKYDIVAVSPNTTIELRDFVFANDDSDRSYYIVASAKAFNLKPIASALKYMTPPEYDMDCYVADIVLTK